MSGKFHGFDGNDDLRRHHAEEKVSATEWIKGLEKEDRDALTYIISGFIAEQTDPNVKIIGQLAQLGYFQLLIDTELSHELN